MTANEDFKKNNLARALFLGSILLFGVYDAATSLVAADYLKSIGYQPFAAETSDILQAAGNVLGPAGFVMVKLGAVIAVFWLVLWLVERSPWMKYSYKALYLGSSLVGLMAGTSNLLGVRASIAAGRPTDAITINGDPMAFINLMYGVLFGLVALGLLADIALLLYGLIRPAEEPSRETAPAQDISQPPLPVADYERFLNAKTQNANIHKGDNL